MVADLIAVSILPSCMVEGFADTHNFPQARKIQGFALSMLQPLDEYKPSPDLFKVNIWPSTLLNG
jgi:hypothetical protein